MRRTSYDGQSRGAPIAARPTALGHAAQDPASMAVAGDAALVRRDDFTEQLPNLAVPTLVIMGAEDPEVGLAAAMAATIPDARFLTCRVPGHLSSVESPQPFETALIDLLIRLDRHAEDRKEKDPEVAAL